MYLHYSALQGTQFAEEAVQLRRISTQQRIGLVKEKHNLMAPRMQGDHRPIKVVHGLQGVGARLQVMQLLADLIADHRPQTNRSHEVIERNTARA